MKRALPFAACLALLGALAAPAYAGPGWDWDEEFTSRFWRTQTLNWARAIHPDHPSDQFLIANYPPPAREMWCDFQAPPMALDYEIHGDLLDEWLRELLDLDPNEALPGGLPAFPPECIR